MGTVNVYSAEHIDELFAGTVVGASLADDHLVLTLEDDSTVDVGSVVTGLTEATTEAAGVIELATDAESITGTAANRAVTPFGLSAAMASALTAARVVSGIAESATPTSYPAGTSVMALTSSAWSLNSGNGLVVTMRVDATHATQVFYTINGGTHFTLSWSRTYHSSDGGGGWTAWQQNMITVALTAGSFTQSTAYTSYPVGRSRLYYTTANSTSWDFAGLAGEVITYSDGSGFARQQFTQHVGGSTIAPAMWIRTATAASGWSPWNIIDNRTKPQYNGSFTGTITNNSNTDLTSSTLFLQGGITKAGADLVVPQAGEYEIGILLRYASQATAAGQRVARFNVNGSDRGFFVIPATSNLNATNITAGGVSRLILAASDTIRFQAFHTAGVSLALLADSHCWVERKS